MTKILYALDFDGVLVDSASETGKSGLAAAKILWNEGTEVWLQPFQDTASTATKDLIQRFCQVRPCLETGWEAALIIKLLADPVEGQPSNEDIMKHFISTLKPQLLQKYSLTKEICNEALKQARNTWISKNHGQDWIHAHDFFHGACQAVQQKLEETTSDNVYIITTKAKEYAMRLLEQQGLYETTVPETDNPNDNDKKNDDTSIQNHPNSKNQKSIPHDNIFGLGSGPKAQVLETLIQKHQADIVVMVEDNLNTLHKIMSSQEIQVKVLPVLACWGYNTVDQQHQARSNHYVLLDDDSSSISQVLYDADVEHLFEEFQTHREKSGES